VLRSVLEAATELTGARYGAIGVLAPDRRSLERFLTLGVDAETQRQIGELPRGRGVLGVLIDEPQALRLADVGSHPRSYGFPIGHPPMHSFLGVPLLIRGEAWGNVYLAEKQGGDFDEADEEAILTLADWAATAIENARLYRSERERRNELERAVRGLEATTEIARAVGGETRLGPILELIVKRGRALVEARGMAILLREGDDLVITAAAGQVPAAVLGTRIGIADSTCGTVLRARRPQRIGKDTPGMSFALADATGATAGLIVPLVFHGRAMGVLEAFDRIGDSHEFSAEDERLMEAFAASAATAVATAQDVAEQTLRRSIDASDRERARWARELHDETLQELSALKITLSSTQRSATPETIREGVATALEYSEHAIAGLREIISDLRPAALDALGTQAALETLVERVRTRANLSVELDLDFSFESGREQTRHTAALEAAVYRITQEAITNTVKHAEATRVSVAITEVEDVLTLRIEDDGRGFDHQAEPGSGFGLIGIRERVELLGGTISISSRPGGGTRIVAVVPVVRRAEPADVEAERT
jgi:signal transduction histidine kinase